MTTSSHVPPKTAGATTQPVRTEAGNPRRWRRRLVVVLVVVAALVTAAIVLSDRLGENHVLVEAAAVTTEVSRRDLVDTVTWDGTLGYTSVAALTHRADPVLSTQVTGSGRNASTVAIETPAQGVLTWVAESSATVDPGGVLYRVDDEPVVLLDGEAVLWRTLDTDTEGADVEALEQALVDLGYDPDGTVTVNTEYTTATEAMVERFQEDIGRTVTGAVELGTVVMRDGAVRIGEHLVPVGSVITDDTDVVVVSETTREAVLGIGPASRGSIAVGDPVSVRLPDRSSVSGTVVSISPTVDAETGLYVGRIAVTDDGGFKSDQLDVTISSSVVVATDSLTVPPDALVWLEGGGYVVQVVDGDDVTMVPVDVLGQAGQSVAITADGLEDGTMVVVTP